MERLALKGIPVSGGIGIGEICVLKQAHLRINKGKIKENKIENEIARLDVAIDKTLFEICDLSNGLRKRLEKESSLIFEAYKTILNDKYFIEEIKDLIVTHNIFAENAVDICISNYIAAIDNSGNEYVKQSVHDIRDLGNRIIRNIVGGKNVKQLVDEVDDKKIVAIKCITPWLAAAFGKKSVRGIFSEKGAAYLSHSAIILRGLGIPAVNGIAYKDIVRYGGNMAVIDGRQGMLIIEPDKPEIAGYEEILKGKEINTEDLFKKKDLPALTPDGRRVGVLANIGNLEECEGVLDSGADGIGLVRTEILFINHSEMPGEEEQYSYYSEIIKKMGMKPVAFRTVDAGEDKIFTGFTSKMSLTKGDLRGIGYSLSHKTQFKAQIKSVLRAAQLGTVSLMFPMVNTAEEIKDAKELMGEAACELTLKMEDITERLRMGAVIESRKGIENIDGILDEVDFISIGTNDLMQQIMGMSRKYSAEDECKYFHPDFLGLVQYCIKKACNKNKPVSVCGEIASDAAGAVLLVGMGVNDLSVHPAKVSEIKGIIRKINYCDAKSVAERALKNGNAGYISAAVKEFIGGAAY